MRKTNEQHEDRREQAEHLGRALLDRRELGLAVVLDGHACRRDRFADGVLDGDDRVAVLVLDRLAELRLGVRDPAVVREGRVRERVGDAREAGLVALRLELVRPDPGDRALDRLTALGRVEPLAGRGGEDDVEDAALLGGELGLDQVGRLLRVRPRES